MKYMVAFLSLFCCVLHADQTRKYITITYPEQEQVLGQSDAIIEVGSVLDMLKGMKNDLASHEDAGNLSSSVAAYYDRLVYAEKPVLYNDFFSQALRVMDDITTYCIGYAERGEVIDHEYVFIHELLSYTNQMAGFLHDVSMELGQDSFAQELKAMQEALQLYGDQAEHGHEVRAPREVH